MKINLEMMDVALILAFRNYELPILDEATLKARMREYVATTDDEITQYLDAIKAQQNAFVISLDEIDNTVIYSLNTLGQNILAQLRNTQASDLYSQHYEFEIPDNPCLSSDADQNPAAHATHQEPENYDLDTVRPLRRILSRKLVAVLHVLKGKALTLEEIIENTYHQFKVKISLAELRSIFPARWHKTAHNRPIRDDHALDLVEVNGIYKASQKARYILTRDGVTAIEKLIADAPDIENRLRANKWPESMKLCYFFLAFEKAEKLSLMEILENMNNLGYVIKRSTLIQFIEGHDTAIFDNVKAYIERSSPHTANNTIFYLNRKGLKRMNHLLALTPPGSSVNNNNASNSSNSSSSSNTNVRFNDDLRFLNSYNHPFQHSNNNNNNAANDVTGNPPSKRAKRN